MSKDLVRAPSHSPLDVQQLNDLLARVESAAGPDLVLDDAIWWCLDCLPQPGLYRQLAHRTRQENMSPPGCKPDWRGLHPYTQPPPLSASIDAALALLERRFPGAEAAIYTNWRLRTDEPSNEDGSWTVRSTTVRGCWVRFYGGPGCHYMGPLYNAECEARTAPLAIVGALLSALLARDAESTRKDAPPPKSPQGREGE